MSKYGVVKTTIGGEGYPCWEVMREDDDHIIAIIWHSSTYPSHILAEKIAAWLNETKTCPALAQEMPVPIPEDQCLLGYNPCSEGSLDCICEKGTQMKVFGVARFKADDNKKTLRNLIIESIYPTRELAELKVKINSEDWPILKYFVIEMEIPNAVFSNDGL